MQMLAAMCLVPEGHRRVLAAMDAYKEYSGECTRWQVWCAPPPPTAVHAQPPRPGRGESPATLCNALALRRRLLRYSSN